MMDPPLDLVTSGRTGLIQLNLHISGGSCDENSMRHDIFRVEKELVAVVLSYRLEEMEGSYNIYGLCPCHATYHPNISRINNYSSTFRELFAIF